MTTHTRAAKDSYILAVLYGQDPLDARYTDLTKVLAAYTNWSTDLTSAALPNNYYPGGGGNGLTFTSKPGMLVKLPPNTGTLDEQPLVLDLEADDFLLTLVSGEPFIPVHLDIWIVFNTIGEGVTENAELFLSPMDCRLSRAVRNADGRKGLVRLEFHTSKARLGMPLGISATPECAWALGDGNCQATVTTENATITAISRSTITVADVGVTGKAAGYWRRGYVTRNGLSIGIRDWTVSTGDLKLVREPPAAWAGQAIVVTPGCDKRPTTCDTRFSNLERFGGFGIAIPARNPVDQIE